MTKKIYVFVANFVDFLEPARLKTMPLKSRFGSKITYICATIQSKEHTYAYIF